MKETNISKTIINLLLDIPIFDRLDPGELKVVSKYMNYMDFESGEIVFNEGEKGDYMCFVVEGRLNILKRTEAGKQVSISSLNRGRSIGEMAVIDDFPRSATVKAHAKSSLLILTRKGFDLILDEHSETGVKILKGIARLLSQNLRKTSSRLADYMLPLS